MQSANDGVAAALIKRLNMNDSVNYSTFVALFWAFTLLGGCTTLPPVQAPIPVAERIRSDNTVGLKIAQDLESQLKIKHSVEVSIYLRKIAQDLSQGFTELKAAPVGVLLIADRDKAMRDYGLPGNRIYLSADLLKRLKFENEVAAAIALELAHIIKRHALIHEEISGARTLEAGAPQSGAETPVTRAGYFGPGGMFAFTSDEQGAAAETAVDILYRAGYDPRGLVALWQVFEANQSRSPFDAGTLSRLMERTRQAIAIYPPLRNPVVRSDAFLQMQKRIRQL